MRIIAGQAKRVTIFAPKGLNTRPTTDRVRESIFNIIQFDVRNARVLDAFAGSGAMGIEALSRGAESALFIDGDRDAINTVKKNLKLTKTEENAKVYLGQSENVVLGLKAKGVENFDLIFLDPPYNKGFVRKIEESLLEAEIIEDGATIVLETDYNHQEKLEDNHFQIKKEVKYGDIAVIFYTYHK